MATPDVHWKRPDGSEVPGYFFSPSDESPTTAGLIVIQEWWGVTPQILAQAQQLSECGYKCLVPDLYRGKIGVDAEEAHHLMGNLDFPAAVEDLKGAATHLKTALGCTKVGVVGFCMGGALSLAAGVLACDLVDGVVAFYGTPAAALCDVARMGVPVQGHFGAEDCFAGFSDPVAVEGLRAQLATSGQESEVFSYPGVGHAFMNDMPEMRKKIEGMPGFGEYKEEMAALAWERTKDFFEKNIKA